MSDAPEMPADPASADLVITDVQEAARRLLAGGLVAIPTETVYGLAARAGDAAAVGRVFRVKGRPTGHPLIVHLSTADELDDWAVDVGDAGRVLAAACWPGPLTLLLHRSRRVLDEITGGRGTVGVRVPAHPLTTALLGTVGALAAPSANRFGRVSPTTAAHVLSDLGPHLDRDRDAILDGGPSPIGVESTIVDCTIDPPQVLRPGGIPTEDVARILGGVLAAPSGPSRASGMLASHYAPACEVRLADSAAAADAEVEQLRDLGRRAGVLDRTADLVGAARSLYDDLRRADAAGLDVIVAVMPPAVGLGHAVRDRLVKASAGSRHGPAGAGPPSRAG
jgi:L-threonylcarbamoyladenylate synthase